MVTKATKNDAPDSEGWERIQSHFVNLNEPGQWIVGKVVSRDTVTFRKNGTPTTVGRYTLTNAVSNVGEWESAQQVKLLGSTILDDYMDSVPDGVMIRVVFTSINKASNTKEFEVSVKAV